LLHQKVGTDVSVFSDPTGMAVTVQNLAGLTVAVCAPIPASVQILKEKIEQQTGVPQALQVMLLGERALRHDEKLDSSKHLEVVLCVDESPLWNWDFDGNPARQHLVCDAGHLRVPCLRTDFVNVVTQEPLRNGLHFFEFVAHHMGDELWFGVVNGKEQAGSSVYQVDLTCSCYCFDGRGQAEIWTFDSRTVRTARSIEIGDVIGMAIDVDAYKIAFAVNGELEFVTDVPRPGPIYCMTCVDTPEDHVELRKPPLSEAPPQLINGLRSGAV